MANLLVINSSPRGDRSLSRALTTQFVQQWTEHHAGSTTVSRDLGHQPVPPVTEAWIIGAFAPPEVRTDEARAAIAVSDELVDGLLASDRDVFSVPRDNLNIPSTCKAYIALIVRVGRNFSVGPNGYEGLVKHRKALFITSSGGAFPAGSPLAAYNFQEPYLRAIAGFIGITDIQFIVADSQNLGEAPAKDSVAKAEATLKDLATSW